MFWIYFAVLPALIVATAMLFAAVRLRPSGSQSRPTHPVLVALLAGAMWPILLVGLTEFAIVMAMPTALHPRRIRHQSGVAAETTALAQR